MMGGGTEVRTVRFSKALSYFVLNQRWAKISEFVLTDPSDSWPGPNCPDFNQGPPLHDGTRASFTLWKILLAFETRYFLPLFTDETSSGTNMVGGVILFLRSKKNGWPPQTMLCSQLFFQGPKKCFYNICSCFLFLSKESSPWLGKSALVLLPSDV